MSARNCSWTTRHGEERQKRIVDDVDQHGARYIKSFCLERQADDHHDAARVAVREDTRTIPRIRREKPAKLATPRINGFRNGCVRTPAETGRGSGKPSLACQSYSTQAMTGSRLRAS